MWNSAPVEHDSSQLSGLWGGGERSRVLECGLLGALGATGETLESIRTP